MSVFCVRSFESFDISYWLSFEVEYGRTLSVGQEAEGKLKLVTPFGGVQNIVVRVTSFSARIDGCQVLLINDCILSSLHYVESEPYDLVLQDRRIESTNFRGNVEELAIDFKILVEGESF